MPVENEMPTVVMMGDYTVVSPPPKTSDVLLLETVREISKAFALNEKDGWFIQSFAEFFEQELDKSDVVQESDIEDFQSESDVEEQIDRAIDSIDWEDKVNDVLNEFDFEDKFTELLDEYVFSDETIESINNQLKKSEDSRLAQLELEVETLQTKIALCLETFEMMKVVFQSLNQVKEKLL